MSTTAIRLRWDQQDLDVFVGQLPKRFAYASVNALRETVKRVQQAEFAQARSAFTIRKERFFFGTDKRVGGIAARVTQFPSVKKGIAFAEIEAGKLPRQNDEISVGRRLLYAGFETGFTRTSFTPGARNVAAPRTGGPARPTRQSPIVPEYTFAKLRMQAFYKGKNVTRPLRKAKKQRAGLLGEYGRLVLPTEAGGVQWKGRNRTFIVFSRKHPEGEVLQRQGRGNESLRLVWMFMKPFPVKPRLEFVSTAQRVAGQFFREETERQVQDVLQHDLKKALREIA